MFIEIGCWGTMVDALRRNLPDQQFDVMFLFSRMPHRIYGHMNEHLPTHLGINTLETIADTFEAYPKGLRRVTSLTVRQLPDGREVVRRALRPRP